MGYEPALTVASPARIPAPRGELSDHVFAALAEAAGARRIDEVEPTDPEDEAVTLFVLQEISYRPMEGVDPAWEEDPSFLSRRASLERDLERRLRERAGVARHSDLATDVRSLLDEADGPSLSAWMEESG
jgi:hypothetical protein